MNVHHQPYSFEGGPAVYPANAFDSRLRGDWVPLGSNPTQSQKRLFLFFDTPDLHNRRKVQGPEAHCLFAWKYTVEHYAYWCPFTVRSDVEERIAEERLA